MWVCKFFIVVRSVCFTTLLGPFKLEVTVKVLEFNSTASPFLLTSLTFGSSIYWAPAICQALCTDRGPDWYQWLQLQSVIKPVAPVNQLGTHPFFWRVTKSEEEFYLLLAYFLLRPTEMSSNITLSAL